MRVRTHLHPHVGGVLSHSELLRPDDWQRLWSNQLGLAEYGRQADHVCHQPSPDSHVSGADGCIRIQHPQTLEGRGCVIIQLWLTLFADQPPENAIFFRRLFFLYFARTFDSHGVKNGL